MVQEIYPYIFQMWVSSRYLIVFNQSNGYKKEPWFVADVSTFELKYLWQFGWQVIVF